MNNSTSPEPSPARAMGLGLFAGIAAGLSGWIDSVWLAQLTLFLAAPTAAWVTARRLGSPAGWATGLALVVAVLGLGLILLLEYALLMNLALSPYLGVTPGSDSGPASALDRLPPTLAVLGSLLGALFGVVAGLLFGPLGRTRY